MGGLSRSMAGIISHIPGMGLPPLPGGLGLPDKPVAVGQGFNQGKNPKDENPQAINQQIANADNYNKALAQLLGQQSQLNMVERSEVYNAYKVGNKDTHKGSGPSDFSSLLSATPFGGDSEQQSAGSNQMQAPAAPQTVGPTPGVPVTPVTATPTGNVAGQTETTGGKKETPKARRGRFATLLAGLGGTVEKFGA